MKRLIVVAMLSMFIFVGCATVAPVVTNVCKAAAYYEAYVAGLSPELALIPVVGAYIADADALIGILDSACKANTSMATIGSTLIDLYNTIVKINTAAGKAGIGTGK